MAKRKRKENIVKLDDIKGFLEEFQGETDRAAVVLGAAYVDECLKQLMTGFLIDDSTKVANLLEGALESFASRISASYCMGLISEDEYHDLQSIREIRNGFAHDLHGLSFSTPWIKNKCAELQLPREAPLWPGSQPGARNQFTVTIALLALQLRLRTLQQEGQRCVVPSGFKVVEKVG